MMRLQDKTALIARSARGIWRAFAAAYAGEGANVLIGDVDLAKAGGNCGCHRSRCGRWLQLDGLTGCQILSRCFFN